MNSFLIKNIILFGFLGLGALWEILDKYQELMPLLSGPVIITLGLWILYEYYTERKEDKSYFDFFIYSGSIAILSWLIEYMGVHTGMIFGNYFYPDTLIPAIEGVPVAIAFAWIVALFSSRAVVIDFYKGSNRFIISLLTATFMTIFDVVMEPAAIEMGYWNWYGIGIPLKNYMSWFGISFVFSLFGEYFRVFENKTPRMASSFYWAMLLYFLAVSML